MRTTPSAPDAETEIFRFVSGATKKIDKKQQNKKITPELNDVINSQIY